MEELMVLREYMLMRVGDNSIVLCIDKMEQIVEELIKQESIEKVSIVNIFIMCLFHAICMCFLQLHRKMIESQ